MLVGILVSLGALAYKYTRLETSVDAVSNKAKENERDLKEQAKRAQDLGERLARLEARAEESGEQAVAVHRLRIEIKRLRNRLRMAANHDPASLEAKVRALEHRLSTIECGQE